MSNTVAPRISPPKLVVEIEQSTQALTLSRLDIHAVITGFLAETTMIMTFTNHDHRDLEGQLYFPLPEGATVCGYGLDIDGEMIDAAIVEKHQARITFEAEVRKGIDPGLVEWVQGNNFQTRIWPIPAGGCRSVKVQYLSELQTSNQETFYFLPLQFELSIADFSLQVDVIQSAQQPQVKDSYWSEFYFQKQGDRYIAKTQLSQVQPTSLRVVLPEVLGQQVVVEADAQKQHYFCIHDFPAIAPAEIETSKPERIGILWDASLSRRKADKEREWGILRKLLAQLHDVEVDLIVFRNVIEAPVHFAVRGGDANDLIQYLSGIPNDGATHFGALHIPRNYRQLHPKPINEAESVSDYAYFLLFSDGLSNLGQASPIGVEVPIYALSEEVTANHAFLESLAQRSNGVYLNLQQLSDAEVVAQIGQPIFRFLGAEYDTSHLSEVFPAPGHAVHSRFTLVGKLHVPQTMITLHYGYGEEISQRVSFTLSQDQAILTNIIPRYWAQHKIANLMIFPDLHRAELIAIGQAFGLVTPGTSLLVLETLEQHLEHQIAPHSSRPLLYQQYWQRVQQQEKDEQQRQHEKLEWVIEQWQQRVEWWQTRFEPSGKSKRSEDFRDEPPTGGFYALDSNVPSGFFMPNDEAVFSYESLEAPDLMARPRAAMPMLAMPMSAMSAGSTHDESITPASPSTARQASIQVKPWQSDTVYLQQMKLAGDTATYEVYLSCRQVYGDSPAFYFDCADFFLSQGQRELGLRVLTNIAELELESPQLLRIVAYRLEQEGELELATTLLENVLQLRPEEPQSYRDLALVLAQQQHYQRAIALLYQVVLGNWDNRFEEIELTASLELNQLLAILQRSEIPLEDGLAIDPRLLQLLDLDLRIVLSWDTDLTDIDLWVIEPSGEKCFYSNKQTQMGGLISRDFTQGYGPEEYLLHAAMPGNYTIQANYYGSSQQTLTGATTLLATIYTHFGRANEQHRTIALRLSQTKEVVDIGTVLISHS